MDFGVRVIAEGLAGDDRACVVRRGEELVVVVADGAGGMAGASAAAEKVVARLPEESLDSVTACEQALERLDQELTHVGESTAVVLVFGKGSVWGASVGDSEAWLLHDGLAIELTADQRRKPVLGSGHARATGFGPRTFRGRLLVGTDGLFKYAAHGRVVQLAVDLVPAEAVLSLTQAARLPSGGLQDDVAVVVVAGLPD